jgi:hypothetical protein
MGTPAPLQPAAICSRFRNRKAGLGQALQYLPDLGSTDVTHLPVETSASHFQTPSDAGPFGALQRERFLPLQVAARRTQSSNHSFNCWANSSPSQSTTWMRGIWNASVDRETRPGKLEQAQAKPLSWRSATVRAE